MAKPVQQWKCRRTGDVVCWCRSSLTVQNKSPCSFWLSLSLPSHADGPPAFTELEREEARGWGVSLWETFVTGVTALLDGWAASIWLQRM